MVIYDYYQKLKTDEEKKKFREIVMRRMGISQSSFYYKFTRDSFRPVERKVINDIIKKFEKCLKG